MSGRYSKRSRIDISASKKMEICQYKLDYPKATQVDLRRHFNKAWGVSIGRSTVSDILKHSDKWLSHPKSSREYLRKRKCKEPELERALSTWFENVRSKNLTVSGDMLIKKAKQFGEELGIEGFAFSSGWLSRFKKRHGISLRTAHGESGEGNFLDDRQFKEFCLVVSDYTLNDVYSMSETFLFYRLEPNMTRVTETATKRMNKERIAIALCSNAAGTDKRTPLVITNDARPRCFGEHFDPNIYVTYRSNESASMTRDIFLEWLENLDLTMRQQKRKILLLLRNGACHELPDDLQNVQVHFFPLTMADHFQPNNAGIIWNFKLRYRRELTKHLLKAIRLNKPMTINLRDGLHLVREAWNSVEAMTISNSWQHILKVPTQQQLYESSEIDSTEEEMVQEIDNGIQSMTAIPELQRLSAREWLEIDHNEEMGYTPFDQATVETVHSPRNESGNESSDDENDAPPHTVQTKDAAEALETLITYLEQCPNLDHVSEHLDNVWAMKRDIDALSSQELLHHTMKEFFRNQTG